jgi:hypothetical protein
MSWRIGEKHSFSVWRIGDPSIEQAFAMGLVRADRVFRGGFRSAQRSRCEMEKMARESTIEPIHVISEEKVGGKATPN